MDDKRKERLVIDYISDNMKAGNEWVREKDIWRLIGWKYDELLDSMVESDVIRKQEEYTCCDGIPGCDCVGIVYSLSDGSVKKDKPKVIYPSYDGVSFEEEWEPIDKRREEIENKVASLIRHVPGKDWKFKQTVNGDETTRTYRAKIKGNDKEYLVEHYYFYKEAPYSGPDEFPHSPTVHENLTVYDGKKEFVRFTGAKMNDLVDDIRYASSKYDQEQEKKKEARRKKKEKKEWFEGQKKALRESKKEIKRLEDAFGD